MSIRRTAKSFLAAALTCIGVACAKEKASAEPPPSQTVRTNAASAEPRAAPTISPESAPTVKELADVDQLQGLLAKSHARFCDSFRIVSHRVVDEGSDKGKPAQLVAYKATAYCSERTLKLCGKIAVSYDAEWKTFGFASGYNYMPDQGVESAGGCEDVSLLPIHCFGCGNKKLAEEMRITGFEFPSLPAAPRPPEHRPAQERDHEPAGYLATDGHQQARQGGE